VRADGVTVWTGSQKPHLVQLGVARLLDMPAEKVRSIWVPGPGSYGRNDAGDAALDAAMLSSSRVNLCAASL
jgi:CO/xanthine dehydrogenase Mo-binding subunit